MIRAFDSRELDELVAELTRPGAVAELAILAGCLVAAWIVVRLVRGHDRPVASVWFGNHIFDGVLFPVLALAFAFAARVALAGAIKPAVFKVAIPILISLVVIRLSVRVLGRTFPRVRWVRTVERSISWLAWIAVVLWITGVSPMVLDAHGRRAAGRSATTQMTLRNVVEGGITAGIRARRSRSGSRRRSSESCSRAAAATTCRCARSPPTSSARCCSSSAC